MEEMLLSQMSLGDSVLRDCMRKPKPTQKMVVLIIRQKLYECSHRIKLITGNKKIYCNCLT